MEQSSNLQGSLIAQMQAIESQEKCAQIYLLIRIFVFFLSISTFCLITVSPTYDFVSVRPLKPNSWFPSGLNRRWLSTSTLCTPVTGPNIDLYLFSSEETLHKWWDIRAVTTNQMCLRDTWTATWDKPVVKWWNITS